MKKKMVKFEVELDADIVRKYREAVNAAYDFCKTPDAYSMADALYYLIECEAAISISKQIVENGPHDGESNISRRDNLKNRILALEARMKYGPIRDAELIKQKELDRRNLAIDACNGKTDQSENITGAYQLCFPSCNIKNGHDIKCSRYLRTKPIKGKPVGSLSSPAVLDKNYLGKCLSSCNPQSGHDPNCNRYKRKLAEDCQKKFPELMEAVKGLIPHVQPHDFYNKKLAEECEKTFPELVDAANTQSRKNFYCRYCKIDMGYNEVRTCSAVLASCSEVAYAGIIQSKLKPECNDLLLHVLR